MFKLKDHVRKSAPIAALTAVGTVAVLASTASAYEQFYYDPANTGNSYNGATASGYITGGAAANVVSPSSTNFYTNFNHHSYAIAGNYPDVHFGTVGGLVDIQPHTSATYNSNKATGVFVHKLIFDAPGYNLSGGTISIRSGGEVDDNAVGTSTVNQLAITPYNGGGQRIYAAQGANLIINHFTGGQYNYTYQQGTGTVTIGALESPNNQPYYALYADSGTVNILNGGTDASTHSLPVMVGIHSSATLTGAPHLSFSPSNGAMPTVEISGGGTFAPGENGVGNFSLSGAYQGVNLTFDSGSFLNLNTSNGTLTDGIALTGFDGNNTNNKGNVNMSGATVNLAGSLNPGTYNIITTDGKYNLNGQFAIGTAPAGYNYSFANAFTYNNYGAITTADVTLTVASTGPTVASWNMSTGGSWNTATNWSPATIPNSVGAQATLGSALTASTGSITLDAAITVGRLTFNNSTHSYSVDPGSGGTLTIDDSTATTPTPSINVTSGFHSITAPVMLAAGGVTVTAATGSGLTLSGVVTDVTAGTGTMTVAGAGTTTVATTGGLFVPVIVSGKLAFASNGTSGGILQQATGSLTVNSGGLLSVVDAGSGNHANRTVLSTSGLTLNGTGTLDLTGNSLVVHHGNLATITGYISTALGTSGPIFSGTSGGITSSLAAADPTHLTTLGVVTGLTTFEGSSVSTTDVLVKYTYFGDANLDGGVDGSDYTKIDNGFNSHLSGWANGDFNYDGTIDGSDYTLIDNAFNTQGASLGTNPLALIASSTAQISGGSSAVPEPTSIAMLVIGATGILARRRRCK